MFVCVSEKCEAMTESAAKKRSSPRTERRVQLASLSSKTSSSPSLKHSQRPLLTVGSSSHSLGRPVRAKLVDSQRSEKSGETKNEDRTVGVMEELEKSKDWIHVTQRELHGIRELVEFLGSLNAADRHIPSEVSCPDELLASAKVMEM